MNYGSIGVVLAHEITHGFDNNGRLHDEFGNVRNWWKKETAAAFQKQKQCFVDQYDAITVNGLDGLHVCPSFLIGTFSIKKLFPSFYPTQKISKIRDPHFKI